MTYHIAIPKESADAFGEYTSQNAGLVFDRFVPDLSKTSDEKGLKKEGFDMAIKAFENKDNNLLKGWNDRWEKTVTSVGAKPFEMKTDWRLIAGLGRKGMLEVGFTFHRYGFPYLPGSSLKGLARAYAVLEIALGVEEAIKSKGEKEPLSNLDNILSNEDVNKFEAGLKTYQPQDANILDKAKAFRYIFGTTEHGGHVIFFDAIPRSMPKLELDIMNPHFPEYYKEGSTEYPTNWQSPIPVYFLTVASGSPFRFAVGWRSAPIDSIPLESITPPEKQKEWSWFKGATQPKPPEKVNGLIKQAQDWLKNGLLELGAGGKTSAGYGYFKE